MSRYAVVTIVFVVLLAGSFAMQGIMTFPAMWYVALIMLYLIISAYGSTVMSAQLFLHARCKASREKKAIALTFDDGPIEGKTGKVLDILKQHGVPAAFFCIGNRVRDNRELLQRIHSEGHLIGNHSYWHASTFDLLSASKVEKELADTDAAIESGVGVTPRFFRPPYGVTNPMIAKAVKKRNYTVIGWSVRSFDTITKDRAKLFSRVTRSLKGGDVILFHDYCDSTLDILPDLLKHVANLGLKVVRVDELLNEKAYG
jgi:peptidoglycan/xylan/chitin deacetylase (PgdA/CDA1 family)